MRTVPPVSQTQVALKGLPGTGLLASQQHCREKPADGRGSTRLLWGFWPPGNSATGFGFWPPGKLPKVLLKEVDVLDLDSFPFSTKTSWSSWKTHVPLKEVTLRPNIDQSEVICGLWLVFPNYLEKSAMKFLLTKPWVWGSPRTSLWPFW